MATNSQDPAAIEQEIRRTQDNMSATVDRIGDQLSIKNLVNAALDKADSNNIDARAILDGARRNPVALGLIAAGTIWLISEKDAKFPSFPSKSGGKHDHGTDRFSSDFGSDYGDYDTHMASVQPNEGEDTADYQTRHDAARSSYFKVQKSANEDDSSFRQRLDSLTAKLREKSSAMGSSATRAKDATWQKSQAAATAVSGKAQNFYTSNPLVGGLVAAAVGAAFGSAVPISRQEQAKLGALGQKARDVVGQQSEQVTAQLRDKKDELLDKADAALTPQNA